MDYLQKAKKYSDFSSLSLKDVQDFILFTRQRVKGRIDAQVHGLKRFLIDLKESGVIRTDLTPAFYQKPPIKRKLLTGFTHDEVNRMLAQPNRDTPVGKRDYAILMLAKGTGLRIGDIVCLKLEDIDWKCDEIAIIQNKTGQPLILPLDLETENAVINYIRSARPKCDLPYLFLRHNAPNNKLAQQTVTVLFTKYRTSAGVSHTIGDGRTFHGLRHSIASWMLEANIPLTTISQVLGHRSLDSAKQYLSVDEKNLKRCSLSLSGIEIAKEGLL